MDLYICLLEFQARNDFRNECLWCFKLTLKFVWLGCCHRHSTLDSSLRDVKFPRRVVKGLSIFSGILHNSWKLLHPQWLKSIHEPSSFPHSSMKYMKTYPLVNRALEYSS